VIVVLVAQVAVHRALRVLLTGIVLVVFWQALLQRNKPLARTDVVVHRLVFEVVKELSKGANTYIRQGLNLW